MKYCKLLIFCTLLLFSVTGHAQRYNPTEPWPYLYEDFSEGSVFTSKGTNMEYDELNINVANGHLHYIQDGVIMEANMSGVHVARIEKDIYLNVNGRLMLLLKEADHCAVVKDREINYDEMAKANIGYGRSAVASTQDVNLMALNGSDNLNKSLLEVEKDKYNGKELKLKEIVYLVVDGLLVRATKSDVLSAEWVDKNAAAAFIKSNKIKFSRPDDLAKLGEFLSEMKNK